MFNVCVRRWLAALIQKIPIVRRWRAALMLIIEVRLHVNHWTIFHMDVIILNAYYDKIRQAYKYMTRHPINLDIT